MNPLVSICCQTYNHVNYIQEALEGFLMQKTNFDFEILLRDDASTDGTTEICMEYALKYPDKINLLAYDENQWQKGVKPFSDNVQRAKGKYIAICEGDDYWTDPLKLKKQVDFLEEHSDYGLVHTNFSSTGGENKRIITRKKTNGDVFIKLLKGQYHIGTMTVIFKKSLLKNVESNSNCIVGDISLWIQLAKQTKFGYIDEVTANYRILEESLSHSENIEKSIKILKNALECRNYFIKLYNINVDHKLALARYYSNIIKLAYEKKEKNISQSYFKKLINLGAKFITIKTIFFYLGSRIFAFRLIINFTYQVKSWASGL
ncbi:glycosyltransferase [uncultured Draconibacterium sp.]|uniref:glycosyltransferase family 2 protein n=1 Tax=uncultured Draconibacterium sp. TaxID=1573823 RepID=UPI0032619C0E